MSLIAIDYDGTYTDDPHAWDVITRMLKMRGHEVICVTMRNEHETIRHSIGCMVYYTGRKAKQPWCQANGLNVDIWIDDKPAWILQDSE